MSLRAAEYIRASAALTALVIPHHAGGWHRRTVRPSLPTARTPQMAANPPERKPNTRLVCEETPNGEFSSQRECGMGMGFAKQTNCSEGFCRRLLKWFMPSPLRLLARLTIQLQHSAFVHQTTSQKGTVCVLPKSNQIV